MASVQYEVHGFEEARVRIHSIPGDVERQISDLMDDAATAARAAMLAGVPRSQDSDQNPDRRSNTIAESIDTERGFHPGGAGGGGFYESTTGPIDNPPSHLLSVIRGSTEYPLLKWRTPGNLTKRYGYPGNFFMHREGQRPQREWIDEGIEAAEILVETRIHTIRIDG